MNFNIERPSSGNKSALTKLSFKIVVTESFPTECVINNVPFLFKAQANGLDDIRNF